MNPKLPLPSVWHGGDSLFLNSALMELWPYVDFILSTDDLHIKKLPAR